MIRIDLKLVKCCYISALLLFCGDEHTTKSKARLQKGLFLCFLFQHRGCFKVKNKLIVFLYAAEENLHGLLSRYTNLSAFSTMLYMQQYLWKLGPFMLRNTSQSLMPDLEPEIPLCVYKVESISLISHLIRHCSYPQGPR